MAEIRPSGVERRCQRRWSFAGCVFDEANWSLIVDGRRVPVEAKPLELLRELLLRAGNVVSKDALLDAIWPAVTVVEASLPTAVRKLRLALGDDRRRRSIIETVPGIGYRFALPVEVENLSAPPDSLATTAAPTQSGHGGSAGPRRTVNGALRFAFAAGLTIGIVAIAFSGFEMTPALATKTVGLEARRQQVMAMRKLDADAVAKMIAAGWDPELPFDKEGDTALDIALEICEWDPGHDQRQLLLLARTLLDGGATVDRRNSFGDTPYSIAKAPRYCGPDHPVTKMIKVHCSPGGKLKESCLASYELKKG